MSANHRTPDLAAAEALVSPSKCPICHADTTEGEQWRAHLATHSHDELVAVTREFMDTLEELIEAAKEMIDSKGLTKP